MPVIKASRNFSPGDLIHSEEPFVHILPRSLKDYFCESCCKRPFNLRACKDCLSVKYCGRPCQKKDWINHRLECKHLEKLPEKNFPDVIRLLGRVILKIKGKDWNNIKTSVLGTEVSFEDIESHYKEITEKVSLNLYCKELKELLKKYIGIENMPGDVDLIKIIGKVMFNTIANRDANVQEICFFLGLFMFEHECVANASFKVDGRALKIWACQKIDKGAEKISVSFRTIFLPNPRFIFSEDKCKCTDCSLPYGESVLSKILDERRAYGVITSSQNSLKRDPFNKFCRLYVYKRHSSVLQTVLFGFKEDVDDVLQKQIGVLGRSHHLHLEVLALRCFEARVSRYEDRKVFMELERDMSAVFGEFYIEMREIYKALAQLNFELGCLFEANVYLSKLEKLENPK